MQLNATARHWGEISRGRIWRLTFRLLMHGLFWPVLVITAMSGRI